MLSFKFVFAPSMFGMLLWRKRKNRAVALMITILSFICLGFD
jgi:aminopeptidase-like protein